MQSCAVRYLHCALIFLVNDIAIHCVDKIHKDWMERERDGGKIGTRLYSEGFG